MPGLSLLYMIASVPEKRLAQNYLWNERYLFVTYVKGAMADAHSFKDKDYCPIEIIKGLTDKGQFQYLTKLMGPQEGTYLYATQFHSLR